MWATRPSKVDKAEQEFDLCNVGASYIGPYTVRANSKPFSTTVFFIVH